MKLLRKYVLYAACAVVILYSFAVLYRVQATVDLGIECLFTDQQGPSDAAGPVIRRVELDDGEYVGQRPRSGDVILRLAGEAVPTFIDFKYRAAQLGRLPLAEEQGDESSELREPGQLADRSEGPGLLEIADDRWVRLELFRPADEGSAEQGRSLVTWIRVQPVPGHRTALSFAWFLLAMMLFAVGGLVFWRRPGDPSSTMFFALCVVNVITFMGAFHWSNLIGSRLLVYPFVFCAMLLAPMSLHFYLLFPRPLRVIRRWPRTTLVSIYLVPSVAIVWMFACLLEINALYRQGGQVDALRGALHELSTLIYSYLAVSVVLFALGQGVLVFSYFRSRTRAQRNQVTWILAAMLLALLPMAYLLYGALFDRAEFAFGQRTRMMIYFTSLLFALAYAVSITRYKLMHVGRILNRGLIYVAISLAATALFCVMVGLGTALVGKYYFHWENAVAVGLTAMLIVVVLGWIRDRFQKALDRRFFHEKYQLDKAMRRLSKAVDQLIEPTQLARQMLQSVLDAVGAERGAVYLRDKAGRNLTLAAQIGLPSAVNRLDAASPLASELRYRGVLSARLGLAVLPSAAQQQLRDSDGELAFALELEGVLVGLVVLGPKEDGEPYTAEDRNFLVALARTTTMALRSAEGHRTIEALKEKMQAKIEKIAEQQQRISFLQGELLSREKSARPSEPVAEAAEPSPGPQALSHGIRGLSPAVRDLLQQVAKVAQSPASVLIRGESGTGKELLAQAIHANSPRAHRPFVAVHCAALSPSLLESELFGHVKGAFTGADRDRIGRFEMADGGTLLLDEVGDISLETQTKLLRVLQEKTFERVGGTQTIRSDVRLIAATHQDLEALIARGQFREDLYYRLNVISLRCPALRERREDVFELAMHFLPYYAQRAGKRIVRIEEDALEVLASYSWPGNIRQLENAIERAVVLAEGDSIGRDDLPPEIVSGAAASPRPVRGAQAAQRSSLRTRSAAPVVIDLSRERLFEELSDFERQRLTDALAQCGGNKSQAARLLGIPRSTLFSKLRKMGLA